MTADETIIRSELSIARARIVDLETALDDLHMHGFDAGNGRHIVVPMVEWQQVFSRVWKEKNSDERKPT